MDLETRQAIFGRSYRTWFSFLEKIMAKKIFIIAFFAIMLLGLAVFESALKLIPQLIFIGLGLVTSAAIWIKIKSIQNFLLNLLIFIGMYTTLFALWSGVLDLVAPDRATAVVAGKRYPLMDWSWVNGMLIGIVGAVVVTLIYHYWLKKLGERFEFYFGVGFVGIGVVMVFL